LDTRFVHSIAEAYVKEKTYLFIVSLSFSVLLRICCYWFNKSHKSNSE